MNKQIDLGSQRCRLARILKRWQQLVSMLCSPLLCLLVHVLQHERKKSALNCALDHGHEERFEVAKADIQVSHHDEINLVSHLRKHLHQIANTGVVVESKMTFCGLHKNGQTQVDVDKAGADVVELYNWWVYKCTRD